MRLLMFLLPCLLLVGSEPQPVTVPPPTGIETLAALQSQLSNHVAAPRFSGALWGVKISSLRTGKTLFETGAEKLMSPGSNCKLFPAAAALVRLGVDYQIRTPLRSSAPVDQNGVLQGDLIVCGRGDPSWIQHEGAGDFWTVFAPFVSTLQKAGVKVIHGDVVADATWLRCPPQGASWTADDMNEGFGAEISAISVLDNEVLLRVSPAAAAGQSCQLEFLSPLTGLSLENHTRTIAPEGERHIVVQRLPGSSRVQVYGELPRGGRAETTEVPVPRPAQWFAVSLVEALRRAGITVEGKPRSVVWPDTPVDTHVTLGIVASLPLRAMVKNLMKNSQNLETDLIFAHLGELCRNDSTPDWMRSDELAVTALEEFLREFKLRPDEVRFDEGSGLSRNDLATPAAFVRLLEFMNSRPEGAAFLDSLPVAGVDGSLRKRFHGTPAQGKAQAKTGTLRYANGLTGFVTTAAQERLAFSLILNRFVPAAGHKSTEELDAILNWLAGYQAKD